MTSSASIAGRQVGPGHPCYIIAEMSGNHNQDYARAAALVRAAAEAGADAVKLQTYTADTITLKSDAEPFRIKGTLWEGRTLHDLYAEAHTPWDWQPKLKALAESLGLDCFSSPVDSTAVEFLESMDVPAYKIASFELVDLPLLRAVAATGKPVILSTGMAGMEEIAEAVEAFRGAGGREVVLLKCTSAYPALPEEANLLTIPDMAERFGLPVGLSDHTPGSVVPVAAVALGACVVEKHLTLRRADGGPDAAFSLEPEEFAAMVRDVRAAEQALGGVFYGVTERQRESLAFRRSLFVARDVARGERFTVDNVRSVRPADGLHTRHLDEVLGRRAASDVKAGTPLSWEMVVSEGEGSG